MCFQPSTKTIWFFPGCPVRRLANNHPGHGRKILHHRYFVWGQGIFYSYIFLQLPSRWCMCLVPRYTLLLYDQSALVPPPPSPEWVEWLHPMLDPWVFKLACLFVCLLRGHCQTSHFLHKMLVLKSLLSVQSPMSCKVVNPQSLLVWRFLATWRAP